MDTYNNGIYCGIMFNDEKLKSTSMSGKLKSTSMSGRKRRAKPCDLVKCYCIQNLNIVHLLLT